MPQLDGAHQTMIVFIYFVPSVDIINRFGNINDLQYQTISLVSLVGQDPKTQFTQREYVWIYGKGKRN